MALSRQQLGWEWQQAFHVPEEAREYWGACRTRGATLQQEWQQRVDAYTQAHPEQAREWQRRLAGELPEGWDADVPTFTADQGSMATRKASGAVLNALAGTLPELVGGSADLGPSNNTTLKGEASLAASEPGGRNVHFGIREHAMGGVLNGMALHGGMRGYGGTFLIFSDYMRASIRLAALMQLPVTYVFTHDSIGLGEDGPTHQPVESLAALRVIPTCWWCARQTPVKQPPPGGSPCNIAPVPWLSP